MNTMRIHTVGTSAIYKYRRLLQLLKVFINTAGIHRHLQLPLAFVGKSGRWRHSSAPAEFSPSVAGKSPGG
jgi:hypothetical protein